MENGSFFSYFRRFSGFFSGFFAGMWDVIQKLPSLWPSDQVTRTL